MNENPLQNYVVWPHRPTFYPPKNTAVFSRLPSFNFRPPPPSNPPGRVNWRGNKPGRRCYSLPADSQPWTTKRSGGKFRRFYYQKRKFTGSGGGGRLAAPFAPRNTTSFIIRAKNSGGLASLVSPCQVSPATLLTPTISPLTEVVVEMAKEEWGVNSYGSMKGLIRLRSDKEDSDDAELETGNSDKDGGGDHSEVEKRLDHDLSRFEMIYPNSGDENRVDEKENQIAHLEEENLTLKDRVFLMERELSELRRRVLCLENPRGDDDFAGDGEVCSENSVGNGLSSGENMDDDDTDGDS